MKPKILVIEDNEQNLYLVTFILERSGYEAIQARDGREGIELANQIKPALLDAATANAKTAAFSFAQSSNSALGGIRNATQGLFTIVDANSSYNSDTDVMKTVRVVTTVQYFLQ